MLAREGGFLVCQCGKRWPIRGLALIDAIEYERRAGIGGAV